MGVGGLALLLLVSYFTLPDLFPEEYEKNLAAAVPASGTVPAEVRVVTHVPTPEPVKALYMTACVAATPSWRSQLKSVVETTELNAVVIDIKDSTGTVSFPTTITAGESKRGCVVKDLQEFIMGLHDSGIYVIGRISVFQDPAYAVAHPELAVKSKVSGGVWKDRKGLSFIDVGAVPYWERIVAIGKAAHEIGFDELNFDYIRYPSDGNMQDASFPWTGTSTKPEMLEKFFVYVQENLEPTGAVLSADLFGMTTSVTSDMGIGQVLERTLPYFDYIAPMVYPSHYPPGWKGFSNPAAHPYEVILLAMSEGRNREMAWHLAAGRATSTPSKLRPWLQDFHLGGTYGVAEVDAQIKAAYDAGLSSWMIWNAGNKYTVAALEPDTDTLRADN